VGLLFEEECSPDSTLCPGCRLVRQLEVELRRLRRLGTVDHLLVVTQGGTSPAACVAAFERCAPPEQIAARLDACLLSDEESAAGPAAWAEMPDPFPHWPYEPHDPRARPLRREPADRF
jgi:hypothetical protein